MGVPAKWDSAVIEFRDFLRKGSEARLQIVDVEQFLAAASFVGAPLRLGACAVEICDNRDGMFMEV